MERLAELVEKSGKSQSEVAQDLELTLAAFNHYIKGRREPSLETLKKMSQYFNCSIDYLVGIESKEPTDDSVSSGAKFLVETFDKALDDAGRQYLLSIAKAMKNTKTK